VRFAQSQHIVGALCTSGSYAARESVQSLDPPHAAVEPAALLLLFHGLGDDAVPFAKFAREMSLPCVCSLALRAPLPLPHGLGGSMWHESFEPDGELIKPVAGEMRRLSSLETQTRPRLLSLLDLLTSAKCGWMPEQIFLFGFSQGGTAALDLMLHAGARLGGVVSVCGHLLPESLAHAQAERLRRSVAVANASTTATTATTVATTSTIATTSTSTSTCTSTSTTIASTTSADSTSAAAASTTGAATAAIAIGGACAHTPTLIIAGERDAVTPLDLSRRLFSLTKSLCGNVPVQMREIQTKVHGMIASEYEMREVMQFFASHMELTSSRMAAIEKDPSVMRVVPNAEGGFTVVQPGHTMGETAGEPERRPSVRSPRTR